MFRVSSIVGLIIVSYNSGDSRNNLMLTLVCLSISFSVAGYITYIDHCNIKTLFTYSSPINAIPPLHTSRIPKSFHRSN